MKTAALISAQMHRNPHLMDSTRASLPVRHEQRRSLSLGRRRRRS